LIVATLGPGKDDTVWEIGPGIGAMTDLVYRNCRNLVLFEIDHGFADFLAETYEPIPSVRLVRGDFRKTWKGAIEDNPAPDLIFGNLPYSQAATMIGDLIVAGLRPRRMVFTIQREVADRMVAVPGSKEYSAFSLVCRYRHVPRKVADIPASAFFPAPDVTSTVVELTPLKETRWIDRAEFFPIVHLLFGSRRKTVRNNLRRGRFFESDDPEGVAVVLSRAGIDGSVRAETLTVETVARLAEIVSTMQSKG